MRLYWNSTRRHSPNVPLYLVGWRGVENWRLNGRNGPEKKSSWKIENLQRISKEFIQRRSWKDVTPPQSLHNSIDFWNREAWLIRHYCFVSRKVGTGYVEGLFDSSPKMTKASNLNLWHFISKWDVAHCCSDALMGWKMTFIWTILNYKQIKLHC